MVGRVRIRHRRQLFAEPLEPRRLLAGDLQNPVLPEDTNNDGIVSPIDALVVIQGLNGGGSAEQEAPQNVSLDVNGDGVRSPMDALHVINNINRGEKESTVPVENRIQNLREAIEQRRLPGHISVDRAREILGTLENGGRPELGDRYRDGQLVRGEGGPSTEENDPSAEVNAPSQPLDGELRDAVTARLRSAIDAGQLPEDLADRATDLLEHLESDVEVRLEDLLSSESGDSEVPGLLEELRDRAANRLREAIEENDIPDFMSANQARALLNSLTNTDTPPDQVLRDLREALRDSQPALREQVSRILSNLDLDEILDQLPTDVGALIEAGIGHLSDSDRDELFAEFVGGDIFDLF